MDIKIVIIGVGEVGFNLVKALSKEKFDITVIDIKEEKCQRITNTMDVRAIVGDGASQRILQQLDMTNIDYLLALTRIDEVNLVAAKSAYEMGAKKIICRLRNTEYSHESAIITPEQFGIDYVVYPEKAAQRDIENLIRQTSAVDLEEFKNGQINMVGIQIAHSSPLVGRNIKNVELSNPYIPHKLALVIRENESFIPPKETIYKKDDIAYFIGKAKDINEIQRMAGKPAFKVKNIMILGAGKIGRLLAKSLQYDYNVRIVEQNFEKAKKFGKTLTDTLILQANGLDIDFLNSENIQETDCFIAATENEQTNILASLLVKHYGVKQVILHITTTNYFKAVRRIGVDAVVSKNISAVNEVLKLIRSDQQDLPVSSFEDLNVDAIELSVVQECRYIRKKLTIDQIPEELCIGAICRNNEMIIPNNHTEIYAEDELLVITKEESISKVEKLFQ
ncbi:MAG: Trk system potassium transporter TrkA [Candidatus Marinimicrobia bacterium]|jgi:trk system potassium uptake protein TrkA|nr:Trk system potassium transporter TrkA [Candidatus Neomarinimicrobiota bacterium]